MNKEKFAVFIDAENLTSWIKDDGPSKLLEELSSIGQVIVRRAYGKWTNTNLSQLQEILNRNGFELLHNFHPVSGKNSSDIQMTVDAMEYALKLNDVGWFVLATGDSDFSPLFRKLREIGKEVIGIGPKSPLSECVKTSCSRYIYTYQDKSLENDVIDLDKEDAEEILKSIVVKTDSPMHLSNLKNQILQIDSAFSERRFGFKNFTSYVESFDFIALEKDMVTYQKPVKKNTIKGDKLNGQIDNVAFYKYLLKKMSWNLIPIKIIEKLYNKSITFDYLTRQQIIDKLLEYNFEGTSSSLVRKTIQILFKSKLMRLQNSELNEEKKWKVVDSDQYIKEIDIAMLSRLISAIKENEKDINNDDLKKLCFGKYSIHEFAQILQIAEKSSIYHDERQHDFETEK